MMEKSQVKVQLPGWEIQTAAFLTYKCRYLAEQGWEPFTVTTDVKDEPTIWFRRYHPTAVAFD